jgi:hypothetical protein
LPHAQPGSKKHKTKARDKVIEFNQLVALMDDDVDGDGSGDDVITNMREAILNIITPLASQGITSITFDQIRQQLQADPSFQGINVTDDVITQAMDGIANLTAQPDPSNNGEMTITLDNTTDSSIAKGQDDRGGQKIDQAAARQATKDLDTPNEF